MRYLLIGFMAFSLATSWYANARGVSPYLPLNLDPEIERQIERVLVLADKPILRRPIAAAIVWDALPKACEKDKELCEEVRRYLTDYMDMRRVTAARVQVAATGGKSRTTIPNRHGQKVDSNWQVDATAYFQPSDFFAVNGGGIVHDGDATATGSFVSLGFDFAQLDVGFRDHWFSGLTDSSSLISTEAATMPAITLSNYEPITPLGVNYEIFLAKMSRQEDIAIFSSTTSGNPRLAGLQLGAEPMVGYSIAINRLMQYGGGARSAAGLSQFRDALFKNTNSPDTNGLTEEFGNQVASITSSVVFPGNVPFAFHLEYAGEDNAYAAGYRLGAIDLSVGLDFPKLFDKFDATVEVSEWQNDWYTHHLYPLGLTNQRDVLGHWFGDQRQFGNAIGGRSETLRVGWRQRAGDYLQATYRTLAYDPDWKFGQPLPPYSRFHELGLTYFTNIREFPVQFELLGGRDVFGESFVRLSGTVDFAGSSRRADASTLDDGGDQSDKTDYFVDLGGFRSRMTKILVFGTPSPPTFSTNSVHAAIGARRAVSQRGDIGARLEFDEAEGYRLLSLRAFDYRYRVFRHVALNGFVGFGRLDYGLPTDGYFWGAGLAYVDAIPKWDIGVDVRHYEKLNRDKTLPTDPPPSAAGHPRLYLDLDAFTFFISRRW